VSTGTNDDELLPACGAPQTAFCRPTSQQFLADYISLPLHRPQVQTFSVAANLPYRLYTAVTTFGHEPQNWQAFPVATTARSAMLAVAFPDRRHPSITAEILSVDIRLRLKGVAPLSGSETSPQEISPQATSEVEALKAELQEARKELELLRSQLAANHSALSRVQTASARQQLQLSNLSDKSVADDAALFASTQMIKHQSDELDVARERLALQAELEAANKELETFSYSVSHDLRSPLRSINGFAKALMEDYGSTLPEEAVRYLEHIERGAVKMGALIDDLLTFSKLSRLDLSQTIIDTNAVAQAAWQDVLADAAEGRKIDFHCETLPKVHADRALIRQALVNLLSNAIKFTGPQSVAKVDVSFSERDTEYEFKVKDNGVGFDPRHADKLFGPFQRLHKVKDFPGTGIGLALVQRIIHRHGGRVWAESEVGQGASFYFTIPKTRGT
jgi:signal transduction histidine kinase